MALARWAAVVLAVAVVCSATSAVDGGKPLATDAAEPPSSLAEPIRLDSCTTISEPGRYVLASDIESRAETCIRIAADDAILDGAGRAVDGGTVRENATGVAVTGANVTVRNLSLSRWTFGIRYENAPDGVVRNVTVRRTVDGVTLASSPRSRVDGATVTSGFTGVSVVESDASAVTDSVTSRLLSSGVLVADSRRVVASNVTVVRSETGIALLGSRRGRVEDAVVRSTRTALLLVDSRANSVANVSLSNPGGTATVALSNATENRIVATNGDWTLLRERSRENRVTNATTRAPGR
ncbi:NosD domain-containing protein [Haladaptatus salinisoli]|uniref:NosD domain-containing protein n=1 Tax=Haladaptatus salinisoli TaxID=2884876 RepID=UPI001D0A5430|nr:NosD domain-containing protein [Haladaptatus salinisoli]